MPKRHDSMDGSISSSTGSKRISCDLVLMCPFTEAAAACGAVPELHAGSQQQCVCVGQIKIARKLMQVVGGKLQPINLQDASNDAIRQLYTYMQVLGICYGELT